MKPKNIGIHKIACHHTRKEYVVLMNNRLEFLIGALERPGEARGDQHTVLETLKRERDALRVRSLLESEEELTAESVRGVLEGRTHPGAQEVPAPLPREQLVRELQLHRIGQSTVSPATLAEGLHAEYVRVLVQTGNVAEAREPLETTAEREAPVATAA